MKTDKEYTDAIVRISRLVRNWMEANPEKDAKIQFNYPRGCFLSAVPQDAIDQGFVSANEHGLELMTAMGAFSDAKESPSIAMIRFAIEYVEEIRKEDENGTSNPRGIRPA